VIRQEVTMTARLAAIVLGIIFVLLGLLGFFTDPVLGLFAVNPLHNLIHIVSGIVLLAGAYSNLGSGPALKIVGIVYVLITILGFFMTGAGGMLLGVVANNTADNWLHLIFAVLMLVAGFALPDDDRGLEM
jgi:hypothetical protein